MSKQHIKSLVFPLLLVLYEISTYLSNDMYLPALPTMIRELNLTDQQSQMTLMIWFAGMATTPLFFGTLSDRIGRKPVLLIGGTIYALTNAACALAPDIHSLLIARFIQGAMIPSMMVAGYATIHELYDHKEAIKILALMGSITIIAPAFGPLLGGFILYFADWRDIFWVIAFWSAATIIALYFKMPETHPVEARHPLNIKTLLGSYWRIVTNKMYMLQMVILGMLFGGFIVWITSGSLLVMEQFHYTPIEYGLVQVFVFAFYILGNKLVDYLVESIGIEKLIRLGLSIGLLGGILLTTLAYCYPLSLNAYILSFTVFSFGTALCFAPLNRMIIESSTEPMGIRVAFFTVFLMLLLAFASYVTGHYYNGTILSMATLTTIAATSAFILKLFCWRRESLPS